MLSLLFILSKMTRKVIESEKFSDTIRNTKMELPSKNYRFSYLSEGAKQTFCTSTIFIIKIVTLKPKLC